MPVSFDLDKVLFRMTVVLIYRKTSFLTQNRHFPQDHRRVILKANSDMKVD